MKENIDVSVIIPVYNAEKYISNNMEALLNQSCKNLEIIAVDDGSSDRSAEILDKYAEGNPGKLRVLHIENGGVYNARKVGIAAAMGKYIAFCDSDDIPLKSMYEKMLSKALGTNADITICPYWRIDLESGKILSTEMTRFKENVFSLEEDPGFLPAVNASLWNKLFLASVIKNAIDFERPPRILEDAMQNCSVYPRCKKIAFLEKPLYKYMVRKDSAISKVFIDELDLVKSNMIKTRNFIKSESADKRMLEVCDAVAFIHFGLSVFIRLIKFDKAEAKKYIKSMYDFLNKNFPLYKKCYFLKPGYNIKNKSVNSKAMFALWFFNMRLLMPVMSAYNFITDKLNIDIKW